MHTSAQGKKSNRRWPYSHSPLTALLCINYASSLSVSGNLQSMADIRSHDIHPEAMTFLCCHGQTLAVLIRSLRVTSEAIPRGFTDRTTEPEPKTQPSESHSELVFYLAHAQIPRHALPVTLVVGGMYTRKVLLFPQDHSVHQPEADYRQQQQKETLQEYRISGE